RAILVLIMLVVMGLNVWSFNHSGNIGLRFFLLVISLVPALASVMVFLLTFIRPDGQGGLMIKFGKFYSRTFGQTIDLNPQDRNVCRLFWETVGRLILLYLCLFAVGAVIVILVASISGVDSAGKKIDFLPRWGLGLFFLTFLLMPLLLIKTNSLYLKLIFRISFVTTAITSLLMIIVYFIQESIRPRVHLPSTEINWSELATIFGIIIAFSVSIVFVAWLAFRFIKVLRVSPMGRFLSALWVAIKTNTCPILSVETAVPKEEKKESTSSENPQGA
ncbi:MAG: hypothetical protein AAB885_02485, partial [Patescibacteria group bacterium]